MEHKATEVLRREEVPKAHTWDLTDLFQTQTEWEKELHSIREDLPTVTKYKGKIHEGPEILLKAIDAREALLQRFIHIATYAKLNLATDGTDPLNQANCSMVGTLNADVKSAISFIESEIFALSDEQMETYLSEYKPLKKYEIYLNNLLTKKRHALHEEAEQVLAGIEEVLGAPYLIYEQSKSSDMSFLPIQTEDGKELPVTFSLYENEYEVSPNTHIRRRAYDSFVQTLKRYEHTYATVYATEVKKHVALAKLRNYDCVTDMLLESQNVTKDVYEQQLDLTFNGLAPIMRKYALLKKKVLGLDELKFCDLKAEIEPTIEPKVTYEEAVQSILESVQVLGNEYVSVIKKAIDERWIDYAHNIGKSTDAFISSPYGKHPYILLTWSNSMRSAFTLTHELGHAVHYYLAGKEQIMANFQPSYYFVEAPSTLNELLLGKHLLKQTKDVQMRRWVILQLLGTYYHNFVTHLLEGELQRRIYQIAEKGQAINASVLREEKHRIISEFWGDAVSIDEDAGLTWMRQSHYYLGLYPYTYSAGLTVATRMVDMIDDEGELAIERWLQVLKAGGSVPPIELIKQAGINMKDPETITQAVNYVGSLIDELWNSYE